jgi:hypothetical protein
MLLERLPAPARAVCALIIGLIAVKPSLSSAAAAAVPADRDARDDDDASD